ncbi:alkaline phosphatase D family protein [Gelidibacter salicanalis]|uniref:Alkaline phosphatase D family protein n=1 Tax=Gelidibacter salicanalis TaxID=291193 RepID=A0A934KQ99_9FLAO|nr:alkaline phosphatase D family protein [Gelidibacter salicanalis]MBJ7880145.1 alkaline phosphatase D family protein [Gelidibacter salicanalis]
MMTNKYLAILLLFINISNAQDESIIRLPDNIKPEDRIAFAMYTVHENTLKLTAQFHPLKNYTPFSASLEIEENGKWIEKAQTEIIYPGYTAPFRIEDWDDTKNKKYRVAYNNEAYYEGLIKKNPIDKEDFVLAALTCNSMYPEHGGDLPKDDIVKNILKLDPDLIFFSGDQVYEHNEHYLAWLKFGREFGETFRNTPVIITPDDHDIGQGNFWGEGGKNTDERRGVYGGYYMPVEYIKEVERAQTGHLPDPYDPTPIERGIGVYYTDLKWGGISFAILEDRKFKSGLTALADEYPEIFPNGPYEAIFDKDIDTRKFDLDGLTLLGERQLKFLEAWTTDWENAEMKTVLSQTALAMVDNYTGKFDREFYADFDSNAWPQAERNKALKIIRKSFSPTITGDTHLGAVTKMGVDDWGDAGYNFTTPAIANFWLRWWHPQNPGKNRDKNAPTYTGEFLDGFKNKITVIAVANPTLPEIKEGGKLSTRAAGFGVIRYNKPNRTITFEAWPRNIDIHDSNSKPYPGWPITISQEDNFVIRKGYELPKLFISEADQVVTIKEQYSREVVSSIRIKGNDYQPKVLHNGEYIIEVGEGSNKKYFENVEALNKNKTSIKVSLK